MIVRINTNTPSPSINLIDCVRPNTEIVAKGKKRAIIVIAAPITPNTYFLLQKSFAFNKYGFIFSMFNPSLFYENIILH
jgi:hypothetical protein